MRHVGLVADDARHVDLFEQVHVLAPGLHAAPADLALGDEELAVVLRRLGGLAERLGDLLGVALRVLVPGLDAGGGIDADAAGRADAELAHLLADGRRPCAPALTKRLRSSASPIAEPPPAPPQIGATNEPTFSP